MPPRPRLVAADRCATTAAPRVDVDGPTTDDHAHRAASRSRRRASTSVDEPPTATRPGSAAAGRRGRLTRGAAPWRIDRAGVTPRSTTARSPARCRARCSTSASRPATRARRADAGRRRGDEDGAPADAAGSTASSPRCSPPSGEQVGRVTPGRHGRMTRRGGERWRGSCPRSTRRSAPVVREFAAKEIAPHAARLGRATPLPVRGRARRWASSGLFGLAAPEEWGGSGGDFASLCVAIEELGRVDQSVGITLSAGVGLGANPILSFGDDDQKARWLPDLVAGRALGAFGLTEPDGGSDAGATRTRAVREGDDWVIDGSKAFITNCGHADHVGDHGDGAHRRGHLGVRRRGRHAGPDHRAGVPQARLARQRHPRPDARRLPRPRRRTCSAQPGPGSATSWRSSTTAASPSPRWRSGVRGPASTRRSPTPRSATRSVGRSGRNQAIAFALADLAVGGRELPQPGVQGGVVEGPGPADRRRPRRWPSCTPPRPRWRRRAPPPRCSAAPGSSRRPSSPGCTATPRSSRSAKAPARSSASSSPASLGLPVD